MRIAVLTSSYPRFKGDGTAPFVMSISEALTKLGHTVQVVAPYDPLVKNDLESNVPVKRFKYIWPDSLHIMGHARSLKADVKLRLLAVILLPFFLIASIVNIIKESRKIQAQIIHAHWVLPNGFAAAIASKILGIPFIISLHGSDIFVADKNALFRAIAKWTFKQSSYVTACSQELFDRAKQIHDDINIELIAWGADPEIFKPIEDSSSIRSTYNWPKDRIVVTTLGRMVHKKGFVQFLEIIPQLVKNNPAVQFVIGGSGPLESVLREKAEQLDILDFVSFPGGIPWNEVPNFLAASDIFVLPSQRDESGNLDGLPTVLLEAMSCGLPCVASDIGGVSLVIQSGENGILIPPDSFTEFRIALDNLIKDNKRRKQLSNSARQSIITYYNWQNIGKKFENLYKISLLYK